MDLYNTIILNEQRGVLSLKINRPHDNNSINNTLVLEILKVLKNAEQDTSIKVIVLEGNDEFFCTGMDFNEVNEAKSDAIQVANPHGYYEMLKCISSCSKVVITKVDGIANAGGIGIVAASDIVIASERATFGLSEALFGLLPACVMPFLARRVGIQKAQWMALITQRISAARAYEIGLVDEISNNTQDCLRRNLIRLTRLETYTIRELKEYMSKLWIINNETEQLAVNKIISLLTSDKVKNNIKNFIENKKYPWEMK